MKEHHSYLPPNERYRKNIKTSFSEFHYTSLLLSLSDFHHTPYTFIVSLCLICTIQKSAITLVTRDKVCERSKVSGSFHVLKLPQTSKTDQPQYD